MDSFCSDLQRLLRGAAPVLAAVVFAVLGGCGGGGADDSAAVPDRSEPTAAAPDTLDAAGGTVRRGAEVTVVVPPDALDAPATFHVAADAGAAPPLPGGTRAVGAIYTITPQGRRFGRPIGVRIAAPSIELAAGESLVLLHAEPGGAWRTRATLEAEAGTLSAEVDTLGAFAVAVVERRQALATSVNAPVTHTLALSCDGLNCAAATGGAFDLTATVASNGGFLPNPSICSNFNVRLRLYAGSGALIGSYGVATAGGSIARVLARPADGRVRVRVEHFCGSTFRQATAERTIAWVMPPSYPNLLVETVAPTSLKVAPGTAVVIEATFAGGASAPRTAGAYGTPTASNGAVVDWQRSDDAGLSWRTIGTSFQSEAKRRPYTNLPDWAFWVSSIRIPVTAADQGARFRARACYDPPDQSVMPCAVSKAVPLAIVNAPTVPAFGVSPSPLRILAGQTASFSAVATGLPAPSFRWQSRPANSTGAWTDVAGATTPAYTTPPLDLASNGVQYRVVATNSAGTTASPVASVSVDAAAVAPSIPQQPQSIRVIEGSDAVFAVRAAGTDALSFQWRHNGVDLVGATAAVLRLPAVDAGDAGDYRVVVSNAVGSVTSAAVALTVADVPATNVPPTIVVPPAGAAVTEGQSIGFSVGVTGTGPFTYQWRRDGVPIAGATSAGYTIAAAAESDEAAYSVVVGGSGVSVTSAAAQLIVSPGPLAAPPTIVAQPASVVVVPGASTTLGVAVSGTAPMNFQWFRNGIAVPGATNATLTLENIDTGAAGAYVVTVSNAYGDADSEIGNVILAGAPQIAVQPADQTATEGGTATFGVTASGSALRYQWTRNGVAIAGATQASYTTPPLTLADDGAFYAAVVYNGAGVELSGTALLSVDPAPPLAGLLAHEGFDYAGGTLLAGQTGGSGWAAGWNVTDGSGSTLAAGSSGAIVAGLAYTDGGGRSLVASGGAWATDAGVFYGQARRATTASFGAAGTSLWMSFLVRQAPTTAGINYAAATPGTGYGFGGAAMIGGIASGGIAFVNCFYCSGGATASSAPLPDASAGAVTLFLVRIDFAASGNDSFSLWINPVLDPGADIGAPAASAASADYAATIAGMTLAWGDNRSFTYDELRLGTSRAAVLPFTGP